MLVFHLDFSSSIVQSNPNNNIPFGLSGFFPFIKNLNKSTTEFKNLTLFHLQFFYK